MNFCEICSGYSLQFIDKSRLWLKSYKINRHATGRPSFVFGLLPLLMAIIMGTVSHALRPKKQLLYADAVLCELPTEVKEPSENRASRMIDGTSVAQTPRNLLVFVKVFCVFFL